MIPFLQLWRLQVPTFGLMVGLSVVAAYYLLRADLARRGLAAKHSGVAEAFIALPCLAGLVGAKLYHVLETPRELFADPVGQLFSRYGLAWFGGLIAGFAAFVWLARRKKIPLLTMLDVGSPAAALGYGIGRIGCLLSGDGDYGKPTLLPWGMSFPNGLVPTTQSCVEWGWPANCRVQPTPIYELLAACVIAWVLWRLGARQIAAMRAANEAGTDAKLSKKAGRQNVPASDTKASAQVTDPDVNQFGARTSFLGAPGAGTVFAAYLLLTGAARFLVEFIRINPRSFFGMTNAQTAGLASFLIGLLLLWKLRDRQRSPVPGGNIPSRKR
ncbi:MAG: prolipoprotein diacylglyceryl transferase [Acidobacteriota bacterium]|nr:prolipoprotein diacylglyceryl transferase [Acidobacteriota bacterium]